MPGVIPPVDPERAPDSAFHRAMIALARTRAMTWYSSNIGARIDPWLVRVSGGRLNTVIKTLPVVLLTVRGARSGVDRTVALVYFTEGEDVVLIASSYGRPKTPAWYFNLKANPRVRLEADGRSGTYVARETDGEERDRLFALATKLYSGYGDYELRTAGVRRIPVMRLTPA
jgi:deazaflavin-dependent oxidoreductase (nitroreductase family)